jgi:hypothetical protein
MFVGVLRVLLRLLTVLVGCDRMFFGLFMRSRFVVMHSLAVVVGGRFVMPGCIVMVLTGGMFHGHGIGPFKGVATRNLDDVCRDASADR